MAALDTWQDKVEDAQDRLVRVRLTLVKRRERLKLTKNRQHAWVSRLDDAEHEHRLQNALHAQQKVAFWHEQFHKAVLGKRDYDAREARLQKRVAYLKAHKPVVPHSTTGVSVPVAPWNPLRRPVANWIIPWLEKSWAAGWRGQVNSGWRDPAYSTSLCYHMCNQPTCPGRCAGATSRHSGSTFPNGAVDVSDYYTFAAVQRRIGSPLKNSLGAADPVHFSYYGN